jgi:acyl carrier protein
MNLEDFIAKFREQFEDTNPDQIQFDTDYKGLDEWSSMMALIIIAFVDEEYNVTLKGDSFASTTSVEDLFNLISIK